MRYFLAFFILCSVHLAMGQVANSFKYITIQNGLISNYVFGAAIDNNNFLWAATDKGLCKHLGGNNWKYWDIDNGLEGNYINAIWADTFGYVYFMINDNGFYAININTYAIVKLIDTKNMALSNYGNNSNSGFATLENKFNKKVLYLKFQYNHSLKMPIVNKANPQIGNYFQVIFSAENNFIYLASIGNKNNSLTVKKSKNHYHYNLPSITDFGFYGANYLAITASHILDYSQFMHPKLVKILGNKIFKSSSLTYAKIIKGKYYLPNMNDGIVVVDSFGYTKCINKANGLNCNQVTQILEGKHGELYLCTLGGGINIMLPYVSNNILHGNINIRQMELNNKSCYALNTVFLYEIKVGPQVNKIDLNTPTMCYNIHKGELKMGTLTGQNTYKYVNGKWILSNQMPYTAGISSIVHNNSHEWIGTFGLGLQEIIKGKVTNYKNKDFCFQNFEKLVLVNNKLAALSYEYGCMLIDTVSKKTTCFNKDKGLLSNKVYCIQNFNDTIIIGTTHGLNFIYNNHIIKKIKLPELNALSSVKQIIPLPKGKWLIMATNSLYLYYNGGLLPISLNGIELEQGNENTCAVYDSITQLIYLSTKTDLYSLNINTTKEELLKPKILQFKVNNYSIGNANFDLKYNFGNIEVKFATQNSLWVLPNKYYYKINNSSWLAVTDTLSINLDNLPPNTYTIWIKALQHQGQFTKAVLLCNFKVNKPWWMQWWFIIIGFLLLCTSIFMVVRYFNQIKYEKQMDEFKLQQKINLERQRISQELHDNVGSQITYINKIAENLLENNSADKMKINSRLIKLQQESKEAMNQLRQSIWAINSESISVPDIILRLNDYGRKMSNEFLISFKFVGQLNCNIQFSATKGLHIYRILHEALNNAFKHSKAHSIELSFYIDQSDVSFIIIDNGVGISNNINTYKMGLMNMQARTLDLNGTISFTNLKSNVNSGTKVQLIIPYIA
jgi:signal transduction histidine kinase